MLQDTKHVLEKNLNICQSWLVFQTAVYTTILWIICFYSSSSLLCLNANLLRSSYLFTISVLWPLGFFLCNPSNVYIKWFLLCWKINNTDYKVCFPSIPVTQPTVNFHSHSCLSFTTSTIFIHYIFSFSYGHVSISSDDNNSYNTLRINSHLNSSVPLLPIFLVYLTTQNFIISKRIIKLQFDDEFTHSSLQCFLQS